MSEPDELLVERIQSGDPAAFEALIRRYFRMAYLVAYAQLNDATDAEDLCQDAFIRCWERISECRDPSRVGAWIAAIVRNAAHNRRSALRVRRTDHLDTRSQIAAPQRSDARAERSELRARLSAALGQLSPVQREVLLLHDLEGWRHAEIALRLELSTMMSRRHLSDARRKVRAQLGDWQTIAPDHD